jgi:hypothetical protein
MKEYVVCPRRRREARGAAKWIQQAHLLATRCLRNETSEEGDDQEALGDLDVALRLELRSQ